MNEIQNLPRVNISINEIISRKMIKINCQRSKLKNLLFSGFQKAFFFMPRFIKVSGAFQVILQLILEKGKPIYEHIYRYFCVCICIESERESATITTFSIWSIIISTLTPCQNHCNYQSYQQPAIMGPLPLPPATNHNQKHHWHSAATLTHPLKPLPTVCFTTSSPLPLPLPSLQLDKVFLIQLKNNPHIK